MAYQPRRKVPPAGFSGVWLAVDNLRALVKNLNEVPRKDVLVGVPAEKAGRDPDVGETSSPLNNAEIAYIQNYGAPEANIPARAFMEPGIRDARRQVQNYLKQGAQHVLKGNYGGMDRALHAAGLTAQASIRHRIQTGPFDPLSARTLAARRRKGRMGDKPLLDTGQLRNSINYVVRDKGPRRK